MSHQLVRNPNRGTWRNACRPLLIGLAIMLPASWCHAATVHFNEISRFDLDSTRTGPSYIGGVPFTVAWNGSKLYVGGLRQTGATTSSIIEVLNPTTTGIVSSPSFGTPFGTIPTTSSHMGYTAIELKGDRLAAAHDSGANATSAIQLFDTTNNSLIWDLSTNTTLTFRGAGGVAFDPGFNGDPAQGGGVAYTRLSNSARNLLNETTGASIYGTANGFNFLPPGNGGASNPRDLTFDPATGDLYVIRNGQVLRATRSGTNTQSSRVKIADVPAGNDLPESDNGQHIAFINSTLVGNLIIYNDVSPPGLNADAPFSDHVNVIDTNGVAQDVSFNFIGGGSAPNSLARYDFSFDFASQTLALLDIDNRSVSIFAVSNQVPEPTTATLLIAAACMAGCVARRRTTTRIFNEGGER